MTSRAPSAPSPADLELSRWGLRFSDAETERAYVHWHAIQAIAFTRLGMMVAIPDWIIVAIALWLAKPDRLLEGVAWIGLLAMPLILAGLAMTWSPRWVHRAMLTTTALGNAAGGFCGLVICWIAGMGDLATTAVCVVAFFGFTLLRLRPLAATLAVGSYVLAEQIWIWMMWSDGTLSTGRAVFELAIVLIAFQSGILTSIVLDRVARQSFRQERIIERQAHEIRMRDLEAKNREVSSLADEVRHQVVERSRELSRAFELQARSPGATSLEAGDLFDRRYRVVRRLGAGGMGVVYEVVRERDARRFALKVLSGATTPEAAIRLTREAEVGAQLRHPNLVPIIDVGLGRTDTPFLVMELVEGGSLEQKRERFGDADWALGVLHGIAAGLSALHAAGVIHRDLKPSNVLMDQGMARICDFGISKRAGQTLVEDSSTAALAETLDASAVQRRLTATGAMVGTPLYMAPEALTQAGIGRAADMFAFGLIAFELITGEFPVALFAAASLFRPGSARALPSLEHIAGVPPPLARALGACVAIIPEERPSAAQILEILGVPSARRAATETAGT